MNVSYQGRDNLMARWPFVLWLEFFIKSRSFE